MVDRIKKIMEVYQLSASAFADKISIQRSGMSHLFSGRNKPSLDLVTKIVDAFPDIPLNWLLLGQGEWDTKVNSDVKTDVNKVKHEQDYTSKSYGVYKDNILPDSKIEIKKDIPVKEERDEIAQLFIVYKDGSFERYKHRRSE